MGNRISSEHHQEDEPTYVVSDYIKKRPNQNIYKRDKKSVYWRGEKIDGVDIASFVDLGYGYGRDDRHVFFEGIHMPKINPKHFTTLVDGYAKYKTRTIYNGNFVKKR